VKRDVWDILSRNLLSPFLNRAVSGLYPPGSVFKAVTSLARGDWAFSAGTIFEVSGGMNIKSV